MFAPAMLTERLAGENVLTGHRDRRNWIGLTGSPRCWPGSKEIAERGNMKLKREWAVSQVLGVRDRWWV